MKINTNSWHYRFAKRMHRTPSSNLCNYFWQVAGPILLISIFTIAWISLVVSLVVAFGFWGVVFRVLIGLAFTLVAVIIFAGIGLLAEEVWERWDEQRPKKPKKTKSYKEKQPNIFFAWLKAKKDKVCPIIEFEQHDWEK